MECFRYPKINPNDRGGSFASIMFETKDAPKFIEGVDLGGEDVDWVREMGEQGRLRIGVPERLMYISLMNTDRIGNLKSQSRNKEERKKSNQKRKEYWASKNIRMSKRLK